MILYPTWREANFFVKLEEKDNGEVFWNNILIKPLRDSKVKIKENDLDVTPNIQKLLTNTNLTTKFSDNYEKETVEDMLYSVGFYDNIPTKS